MHDRSTSRKLTVNTAHHANFSEQDIQRRGRERERYRERHRERECPSPSASLPLPRVLSAATPTSKPEILAGGTLGLTHWLSVATIPNSRNYTDDVLLGIWDIWEKKSADIRLELSSSASADKGTVARASAWAGTSEYSVGVTYLKVSSTISQVFGMDWGTHQLDTNPDPLPTTTNCRVRFFREYVSPPVVVVWLNRLDMSSGTAWCVNVTASHVSTTGFMLNVNTWNESIVYGVGISWVAYSPKSGRVWSGVLGGGMRGSSTPKRGLKGIELFPEQKTKIKVTPTVLMGISGFDVDNSADLRVRLDRSNVTDWGMYWSFTGVFRDTALKNAVGQYLAFVLP